eukprot:g76858.t1
MSITIRSVKGVRNVSRSDPLSLLLFISDVTRWSGNLIVNVSSLAPSGFSWILFIISILGSSGIFGFILNSFQLLVYGRGLRISFNLGGILDFSSQSTTRGVLP